MGGCGIMGGVCEYCIWGTIFLIFEGFAHTSLDTLVWYTCSKNIHNTHLCFTGK